MIFKTVELIDCCVKLDNSKQMLQVPNKYYY